MLQVQKVDDAISLVTDPRFTHHPAAEFPSGRKLPDPEKLAGGPLAMFTLASIAWHFMLRGTWPGRRHF